MQKMSSILLFIFLGRHVVRIVFILHRLPAYVPYFVQKHDKMNSVQYVTYEMVP